MTISGKLFDSMSNIANISIDTAHSSTVTELGLASTGKFQLFELLPTIEIPGKLFNLLILAVNHNQLVHCKQNV